MALDPTALSDELKAKMLEVPDASDNEAMKKFCDAIAQAIIEHIKANAVVDGSSIT